MSISVQALGRFFLAGATLFAPANNFSTHAGEQKTSATEDASNPNYLKGKQESEIDALVKEAIQDPNSDFTYKLFLNPKLHLKPKYVEFITDEKYFDTPNAKIIAKLPHFPISKEHMKFSEEHPDTELAQIISDNLNNKLHTGVSTTVTDASFEKKVLKADQDKIVHVDFWASWCGHCLRVSPILEEIAKEINKKLIIVKLNVDQNPKIKDKYSNQGRLPIPVLMLFKGGQQIVYDASATLDEYTKEKVSNALKEYIK